MRRTILLVAAAACLLAPPPARALINPNYTPVDLVRQSEVILRLEVSPPDAKGQMGVKVVEALQGKAPAKLALTADLPDEKVKAALARAFGGGKKAAAAVLFSGDFSAASDEGAAERGGPRKPVGMLHVRIEQAAETSRWFALFQGAGGALLVAADPLDMRAVWAGSNAQLLRAVRHIQADSRADMPTAVGVHWGEEQPLGKLAGAVHGATVVDLDGSGAPVLHVAADAGDRLYAAAGRKLEDVTARHKLTTKSKSAAWADFDGDGRLDLASSDGKGVSVALGQADGTFELKAGAGGFGVTPIGLGVAAGKGKAALLVSTPAEPVLMTLGADGLFVHKALPAPAGGYQPLGEAGPCAVADFDNDGLPDVLQPFAKGALFYQASAPGEFAAPKPAVDAGLGGRPAGAAAGDFDADGRLDVLLTGKGGCCVLHNAGGGAFRETLDEAGEVAYTSQHLAAGGAVFDINNDGRLDFFLMRTDMPPLFYFNRGFECFGYAADLELARSELKCAPAVEQGQQAAAVADFDADGTQDVAFVAANGEVWVVFRDASQGATLGLTVALPAGAAGPANVSAADGKRPLGARVVTPGTSVLFGKVTKGPLDVSWHPSGGKARTRRVIVLKPARVVLDVGGEGPAR